MKLTSKDISPLWLPCLAVVVALALGWVMIGYSNHDLAQSRSRLSQWTSELQEARTRFQRSDDEKAMILRYLPTYSALQQQGFVGTERRLEWVEALRTADRKAGLHGVQYKIEPQDSTTHPAAKGVIEKRLRRSVMRLTLGLTHEADLLEFLDTLSAQGAGVFTVRSCGLTALPVGDPAPRRANLQAECEIDWLTVAPGQEPKS